MLRVAYRAFIGSSLLVLLFAESTAAASSPSNPQLAGGQAPSADRAQAGSPLRGRVTLTDGGVIEGFLAWNRHATTPADLLTGLRTVSEEGLEFRTIVSERTAADRRRSVDLPGVRVTWEEEDPDLARLVRAGIRLHWIERLTPDEDALLVELRTGETVELRSAGTDVGSGFRGLEVEESGGSLRTLPWEDIAVVELLPGGSSAQSDRRRIHGTVETASGTTFTGWIVWDADETWMTDVLDGERDDVRFDGLAVIEALADGGVEVTLASGERRTLRGTNDVGDGNRGIRVSDPGLGRATVSWEAFRRLRLHPPVSPTSTEPASDPPSDPGPTGVERTSIEGEVRTREGEVLRGRIVWDLDESRSWNVLNGEADGVVVEVEFSEIVRVEKADDTDGVVVTLGDGRRLALAGSNDVGPENRGIGVTGADGERRIVDWDDVEWMDLAGPAGGA